MRKTYAVIGLFAIAGLAQAAVTGSVVLSGTVPAVVSVTISGTAGDNTLDLTTTQAALQIASVQEQSNDINGYKVTAASTNAGKLVNGTNNVTYTAKYNGVAFTLSATAVNVTTQGAQVAVVNVTKPLTIAYTGAASTSMMSGIYTDTITFTISAN